MWLCACMAGPQAVEKDGPPASTPTPAVVDAPTSPPPAPPPAAGTTWREPAAAVRDLVLAPPTPGAWIDPTGARLMITHSAPMPPIAEVARSFAPLAGMRIDERRGAQRRVRTLAGIEVVDIADGSATTIMRAATIASPRWSPDGSRLAWLVLRDDKVMLHSARASGSDGREITEVLDVLAPAFELGNEEMLVIVPANSGPAPDRRSLPSGPVIEDAAGERAQNRTYQDLLANERDEAAFEHYATGQLAWASYDAAGAKPFGAKGMFTEVSTSPDGKLLLVERVRRPFSYVVPFERFGRVVEVWDREGNVVATIADQEPAETIPIDGVRTGPRQVEWLATEPATLVWFEALDDGDPRKKVPHRDKLVRAEAPFTAPTEVMKLEHRARSFTPLDDGKRALVGEYDRDRRWTTTWLGDVRPGGAATKLFDRSSLDAYGNPGTPVTRVLPSGHPAIALVDGAIFLKGDGATPKGDRPFLDRMVLDSKATTRVVASTDDTQVDFLGFEGLIGGSSVVVMRQSQQVAPNVHVVGGYNERALTTWPEPHPSMRGVSRKLLKYQRKDGVELSGTLYTPAGTPPEGGWPLLVWAYPIEFNDRDTAGQVRAATNVYPRVTASSPLALLAAGYAVLDDAAMPVVGDPETMNDTLLEQLEAAAAAAIDAAAATGAIDRTRVAVGGHSYGAFMTANLLAHTELFRAGIARSGAYNRTLTPFGYQSERRTLWEAPETYAKVSPLLHADKIDEPILLIHGELDDNSGTFPLQSQRLFSAIRGSGGVARLVMLPGEAHGYTARENLLHMLAEEIDWLDAHVRKPAG